MFRDKTNLFITYRRTFPHYDTKLKKSSSKRKNNKKSKFDKLPEEELGLIRNSNDGTNLFEISDDDSYDRSDRNFDDLSLNDGNSKDMELASLQPVYVDISDEIGSLLSQISIKVEDLNQLYKKNLLPGFTDRTLDEKEIEKLNYDITLRFQHCYSLIKKLENIKVRNLENGTFKNKSEVLMLENIKKNCALRIQHSSSEFRKMQNNYIKFLKEDDFEPVTGDLDTSVNYSSSGVGNDHYDPVIEELETREVEKYSRDAIKQTQSHLQQSTNLDSLVRQRETEINKIARGVLEVSAIFKEMQTMVIEQGTILDRIDYNLENTKVELKQANKELTRATNYQKLNNKCRLILLLILVVLALIMILIIKPKGHHSNSKPSNELQNDDTSPGNVESSNEPKIQDPEAHNGPLLFL